MAAALASSINRLIWPGVNGAEPSSVTEADDEVKANLAFAGSRDENGTLIYERPLKPEGSRP